MTFDQYPYGAGATLLASLLPAWAQAGGAAATLERVMDAAGAPRDRARHPSTASRAGRTCSGRSARSGSSSDGRTHAPSGAATTVDTVCELLLESDLAAPMILHYASDEAVRTIAAHPLQLVGSDGIFGARAASAALRHRAAVPRSARDPRGPDPGRGGGRPADRPRRATASGSRTEAGSSRACAPTSSCSTRRRYVDTATYEDPKQSPPTACSGVWVAGQAVVRDGAVTGARPGGVLRS